MTQQCSADPWATCMAGRCTKFHEMAFEMGVPIIGLNDSPGARSLKPDLAGSDDPYRISDEKHAGVVFFCEHTCFGSIPSDQRDSRDLHRSSVYMPALTDFIFMVNGISICLLRGPTS